MIKKVPNATVVAGQAVLTFDGREKREFWWSCAFHHASDLIEYSQGNRRTTRCLDDYEPNEVELEVERILDDHGIWRGMRERVRPLFAA